MALNTAYKDTLIKIVHTYVPGCTIYLFGSRATNTERVGSDIDIALDAGKPIAYTILLKIMVAIDDTIIPMKVDVVDLATASSEIQEAVKKEGILWTN